jgi:hypothetical protein
MGPPSTGPLGFQSKALCQLCAFGLMISATAITISQVFRKGVRWAGGLQPLIAVLRLFFSSGIPVRPVRQDNTVRGSSIMLLYHFFVAPVVIYVIAQLILGTIRWQRYGTKGNEIPSQIVALAAGISVLWLPQSDAINAFVDQFKMDADLHQFFTVMMLYSSILCVAGFLAQQEGMIDSSHLAEPYPLVNNGRGSGIGFLRSVAAPIAPLCSSGSAGRRLRTQAVQYGLVSACGAAYASVFLWKWFLDENSSDGDRSALMFAAGCIFCIAFGIFRWQIGANVAPKQSTKSTD